MYKKFFKRQLDFIFAMVGILVLFPIFIVAFVALYFSNKGQPFFTKNVQEDMVMYLKLLNSKL